MALLLDWRFWAGLGIAALVAWGIVQTARLNGCKDSLAAAQQQVTIMGAQIRQQNAAVDALKTTSDARIAESAKAAQEARRTTQAAVGEAARLRSVAAKGGDGGKPAPANQPGCVPSGADRAAAAIRSGL